MLQANTLGLNEGIFGGKEHSNHVKYRNMHLILVFWPLIQKYTSILSLPLYFDYDYVYCEYIVQFIKLIYSDYYI